MIQVKRSFVFLFPGTCRSHSFYIVWFLEPHRFIQHKDLFIIYGFFYDKQLIHNLKGNIKLGLPKKGQFKRLIT